MTKTVLILGASGKIGRHASAAFASGGWVIRKHDRLHGDLMQDARGADVIVNGLNPPQYRDWARSIPAITRSVIAAAEASGATVIVPGNVYNIGPQGGEWSESTPHRPNTRKGRIREEMERAYEASRARTIVLRAGNFIDPEGQDDVMSLLFLREIRRNKLMLAGDPSAMQAYCYLPDWASAAVALAEKRAALAAFEDIPFPGHAFTAEELRPFVERTLGAAIAFTNLPWWLFTALSPFWELAREMHEMRYLWSTPHTLSGTKLTRLLPDFRATPLETVLRTALSAELQRRAAPNDERTRTAASGGT